MFKFHPSSLLSTFIRRLASAIVVAFVCAGSAQAGLVRQVNGDGKLSGATGVSVGAALYDVVFEDGTCQTYFSGCNGPEDFVFNSVEAATNASQALLDQVFLDIVGGSQWDSILGNIFGCPSTFKCIAWTPYAISTTISGAVNIVGAQNYRFIDGIVNQPDSTRASAIQVSSGSNANLASNSEGVWAVWVLSAAVTPPPPPPSSEIPEPSSLALLGLAAVALVSSQRRRIRAKRQIS